MGIVKGWHNGNHFYGSLHRKLRSICQQLRKRMDGGKSDYKGAQYAGQGSILYIVCTATLMILMVFCKKI
jgi:hypothetical protein